MVRMSVAALLLMVVSVPAFAQDDYPRVEMSIGYSNIGFNGIPQLTCLPGQCKSTRHSGFTSTQGFNFKSWLGVENMLGYYGLGNNLSMLSNTFGLKAAFRGGGPITPYGVAGLGGGSLFSERSGGGAGGFNTRLGVGFEYGAADGMRFRVDASRMGAKYFDVSQTSFALSFGVAFSIM